MASKGQALRKLMKRGALPLPGVFNAITAKLAAAAGFQAAYVSGAGVTNSLTGLPDIGLLTLTEMAAQIRYMTKATSLPLLCDADTGFGELFNVKRCVLEYEASGAAGLHIEDQENPKRCGHLAGKSVVPVQEMVRKIKAAVDARQDRDFLIVARTDARSVEGFQAAVDRARAYRLAGADMVFPEALQDAKEFAGFARLHRAPLMANMTEFGQSPLLSVKELGRMGYSLVIFPMTAFRVMARAAEETYAEIARSGSQKKLLPRMQTRAELYELLGYTDYLKQDEKFSKK